MPNLQFVTERIFFAMQFHLLKQTNHDSGRAAVFIVTVTERGRSTESRTNSG